MLEFEEYRQKLNSEKPKLDMLRTALKLDAAEREIEELEAASAREGFWNDVEKSRKVQKRLKTLQNRRDHYQRLCGSWDDMMTLCEMAMEEGDDSLLEELQAEYAAFEKNVEETRLSTLLTGEYDANNAILTFHAGAGGTEAQDWASMLYRMYNMWADRHGYNGQRHAQNIDPLLAQTQAIVKLALDPLLQTDHQVDIRRLQHIVSLLCRRHLRKCRRVAQPQFHILIEDLLVHPSVVLQHEGIIRIGHNQHIKDAARHQIDKRHVLQIEFIPLLWYLVHFFHIGGKVTKK